MNKLLSFIAFALTLTSFPNLAFSRTLVQVNDAQYRLDRGRIPLADRVGRSLFKHTTKYVKCSYNFATQGGAVGAISLLDEDGRACTLPNKAIIRDALLDVVTAPTSGGSATIAFGSGQATNDLKAATAIASLTGLVAGVPVGTAATAIKLTADRSPTLTVAVAALTAGKINVLIQYQISE